MGSDKEITPFQDPLVGFRVGVNLHALKRHVFSICKFEYLFAFFCAVSGSLHVLHKAACSVRADALRHKQLLKPFLCHFFGTSCHSCQ